jgi:hypothetical protein
MCRWARSTLEAGTSKGIGANTLTDRARDVGIRAYRECIQRYALHGLLSWVLRAVESGKGLDLNTIHFELLARDAGSLPLFDPTEKVEWPDFPWDRKEFSEWEYQRSLLMEEFPPPVDSNIPKWLEQLLMTLVTLEKDYARRIHKSKSRDDSRGGKTIPGYAQAHVAADKDPVIFDARRMVENVESSVSDILGRLSSSSLSARSRL